MTTKLNPGKPDGGETLFSKGYKYRDGGPVSDACGDNQHEKCTLDFTKCNCHYRGLHKTPHVYATAPSPQPSAEATEPRIDRLDYIKALIAELPIDPDLARLLQMIHEELAVLRGRTQTSESFIGAIRREVQR